MREVLKILQSVADTLNDEVKMFEKDEDVVTGHLEDAISAIYEAMDHIRDYLK